MQDVPKTADHSAARTFFLWGVDTTKCIEALMMECYQALTNLKTRRVYIGEENVIILDKLSRSDVAEDTDAWLSQHEKEAWEFYKRVQEFLSVSEMRIDKQLLVFRDC